MLSPRVNYVRSNNLGFFREELNGFINDICSECLRPNSLIQNLFDCLPLLLLFHYCYFTCVLFARAHNKINSIKMI